MYVLLVAIQIDPQHREEFIAASMGDATGSVGDEPGCLRFDVVQDEKDPNRLYFYEVYKDKAAFDSHLQAPHFIRWRDTVKDWYAAPTVVYKGFGLYPPDDRYRAQT